MFTPEALALTEGFVSRADVAQGSQARARRSKLLVSLLSSRRLPKTGWDDASIEAFIADASAMDSNNFLDNVGVGEREGRVFSPLVARRHWNLAHGIGRSGDVAAEQPKAAGSSLLSKLTNLLVADAMRVAGMEDMGPALVLPLATGMTLTLVLLAMRQKRPKTARKVVWCRLDQKTCVKAVVGAGLELVVVPPLLRGDELVTDVAAIERAIDASECGADDIVCVVTSTSCFAPRGCDDIAAVAKLCAARGVGHVVNHAYGVQARQLCDAVTRGWRRGRVDAVVQSTDKNFMVPVGGAIVTSGKGDTSVVDLVRKNYPGRASVAPSLDVLITLLSMGEDGWRRVLREREEAHAYMLDRLKRVAAEHGERVLETPGNPISIGVTLAGLAGTEEGAGGDGDGGAKDDRDAASTRASDVSFFGSMLFSRAVSGTRVVAPGKTQVVGGVTFEGFGASHDAYPTPYFTAAAALGTTKRDADAFCERLGKCFADHARKMRKKRGGEAAGGGGVGANGEADVREGIERVAV